MYHMLCMYHALNINTRYDVSYVIYQYKICIIHFVSILDMYPTLYINTRYVLISMYQNEICILHYVSL